MQIAAIAAVVGVVVFAGSNALSYSKGSSHGADARDSYWKTHIAAADKRASDAEDKAKLATRASDKQAAEDLARKDEKIRELTYEIENARAQVPLPAGCNSCFIDRRRVERVRDVRAPGTSGANQNHRP